MKRLLEKLLTFIGFGPSPCSPFAWTTAKPTEPGWYWWDPQGPQAIASCSYGGIPLIVEIDEQGWDKKLYMADGSAYGDNPLVDEIPGRWAGPIPFPSENTATQGGRKPFPAVHGSLPNDPITPDTEPS